MSCPDCGCGSTGSSYVHEDGSIYMGSMTNLPKGLKHQRNCLSCGYAYDMRAENKLVEKWMEKADEQSN